MAKGLRMFFLPSRRLARAYSLLVLVATNLVTSMPLPPSKRSPEEVARNGFSKEPKVLEIQLPLKIATKEDLVAWAKYVMGLMASKINITLSTVQEPPPTTNLGNMKLSAKNASLSPKTTNEKQMTGLNSPGSRIDGVNAKIALNDRQRSQNLGNPMIQKTNGRIPFEAVGHFNVPGSKMNELDPRSVFVVPTALRIQDGRQLFLPQYPDFGTRSTYDIKNNEILRNSNVLTPPPSGMYLPLPVKTNENLKFTNVNLKFTNENSKFINENLKFTNENSKFTNENLKFTNENPKFINENLKFANENPKFINENLKFTNENPKFTNEKLTNDNSKFRNDNLKFTSDNLNFQSDPFATRYFFDGLERNVSGNLEIIPPGVSMTAASPPTPKVNANNLPAFEIFNPTGGTASRGLKPILSLPFEAVITITREESGEMTTKTERNEYLLSRTREPSDEFPPYNEKNYTLTNESGQINVVFDDFDREVATRDSRLTDGKPEEDKGKEETRKDSAKKQRARKQRTRKQQSVTIANLAKMLRALRNNSSAELNLSPPPLKVSKGTASQKAKIMADMEFTLARERQNQTSQAQELEDDVDVVPVTDNGDNDDGMKTSGNQEYDGYDDDDDEGMGGSVQSILELLPLVAPILDDLSDPTTETDIGELLQAALPLIQGLSEGDGDEEGVDIPGILVPILMNIIGGPDGNGDSGAILGPIIQLVAPFIGPILGPLLGPLIRQISNPPEGGGSDSSSIIQAVLGPLSQPTGPGKTSPLSTIITGVVSSLSKQLADGKSGLSLSTLVGQVVSGVVAGTSAGLSGHKDSAVAPTSYGGGYGGYGPNHGPASTTNPIALIGTTVKDVLNGGLKIVSSLTSALTGILGASSQDTPRPYGPPPTSYGAPPSSYAAQNAPFTRTTRPPNKQKRT